ncbi:MAG: 4Fe-4S dicluster domain-containing protein [Clostridia bacterium]|nr:4Fe-4S dicluster domain-containing protein [Clostridia bacterium]
MQELALKKIASGEVDRVLAWKKGESYFDVSPAIFKESFDGFTYNAFCGANLSKFLVEETKKEGKVLVFLKPCDTYSFNQLLSEHRINREKVYVVGIECQGKLDINKVYAKGIDGILDIEETDSELKIKTIYGDKTVKKDEVFSVKCETCKSKKLVVFDEKIVLNEMKDNKEKRFDIVEKLESMTEEERFAFWQAELSKCIRCNACRNVCPACTCTNCVFDNNKSGIAGKANADSFEEKLYHIIRAFHVAGRCTDCGECSRVCPQGIPLHLINRKIIKDMNTNYGEYQAGETVTPLNPIVDFKKDDVEANTVVGGKK